MEISSDSPAPLAGETAPRPSDAAKGLPACAPLPKTGPGRPGRRWLVLVLCALGLGGAGYGFSYVNRPQYIYQRALQALARDDFDQAHYDLGRLQARREYEPQASLIAGILLLQEQKLDEALGEFRFAVNHPDTRVLARTLIGRTLCQQHRFQDGERNLLAALQFDPGQAEAHRWLGVLYYDVGAMQQAEVHLRHAAELVPFDPKPPRLLGLIHSDVHDLQAALSNYTEAVRRDAAHPGQMKPGDRQELLVELAGTQVQLLRYSEALATLRDANETADVLALRAECHNAQGDSGRSHDCLDAALRFDPSHSRSLRVKGRLALDSNDPAAALGFLERALEKHPRDQSLHFLLSRAHHRLGHEEPAKRHAETYEELGELGRQFAELNQRAALEPKQPHICFQLGLLAERLAMREAAANWYRATLTRDPGHAGARRRLLEMFVDADSTGDGPP